MLVGDNQLVKICTIDNYVVVFSFPGDPERDSFITQLRIICQNITEIGEILKQSNRISFPNLLDRMTQEVVVRIIYSDEFSDFIDKLDDFLESLHTLSAPR